MPYTSKKANLPEGFHDLGEEIKEANYPDIAPSSEEVKSIHYPSLYFENAEALSKFPKEGTATIHFKKIMEKKETTMRDGKEEKRHCVELQINGIKPEGASKMENTGEKEFSAEDAIETGLAAAESEDMEENKNEKD
jgi:hypothetical protein